jgi:hypothetical protein
MQYLQLQHQTIMTFPAYRTGTDTRMQVPFPGVTQQYRTRSVRRYKLNSIFCWRLLETATPLLIAGVNR